MRRWCRSPSCSRRRRRRRSCPASTHAPWGRRAPPPSSTSPSPWSGRAAGSSAGCNTARPSTTPRPRRACWPSSKCCWRGLLAAATGVELPVAALPLLRAPELQQLQREWNDTAAAAAGETGVHEMVAAQATRRPLATAVVWAGGRLSYGDLNAWSDHLARQLAASGAGPETRVAVCLPRSPALVAAWLAVLKAGACYVPLDPAQPAERLAFMLADSGAPCLLASAGTAERLPRFHGEVLGVGPAPPRAAGSPGVDVAPEAAAAGGDAPRGAARQPRLCHLHVRLDRPSQGRRGLPPGVAQSGRLAPARLPDERRRPHDAGGQPGIRRGGMGAVALPGGRRRGPPARRRGAPRRRAAARLAGGRGDHLRLPADGARRGGVAARLAG